MDFLSAAHQAHRSACRMCVLIAASSIAISSCKDQSEENFERMELSGQQSAPVIIPSHTNVYVASDLIFNSSSDSALVIEGEVHFYIDAGVSITLPQGLILPPNHQVLFTSSGAASWRGIEFGTGDLLLQDVEISKCDFGLVSNGANLIVLNSCNIRQITQTAIQITNVDSMLISACNITDAGRYGIFSEHNCPSLNITNSDIGFCAEGIRINRGQLRLYNTYVHDCSTIGIYTHLESASVISHCDFNDNNVHLWFQNTRDLDVQYNQLHSSSDFPIKIVQRSGTFLFASNNVNPNISGYLVNLEDGDFVAEGNYWGSVDSLSISAGMYDGHLVPGRGLVDYSPFLLAAVPTAGIED